jgi:hypothetical protein
MTIVFSAMRVWTGGEASKEDWEAASAIYRNKS